MGSDRRRPAYLSRKVITESDADACACLRGRLEWDKKRPIPHPRTRGECPAQRPCPYAGCRYHLALDTRRASLFVLHPDLEIWELRETCALDVAERGGRKLEEVAAILGVTRERVRQIEARALAKLVAAGVDADWIPAEPPLSCRATPRGYAEPAISDQPLIPYSHSGGGPGRYGEEK